MTNKFWLQERGSPNIEQFTYFYSSTITYSHLVFFNDIVQICTRYLNSFIFSIVLQCFIIQKFSCPILLTIDIFDSTSQSIAKRFIQIKIRISRDEQASLLYSTILATISESIPSKILLYHEFHASSNSLHTVQIFVSSIEQHQMLGMKPMIQSPSSSCIMPPPPAF